MYASACVNVRRARGCVRESPPSLLFLAANKISQDPPPSGRFCRNRFFALCVYGTYGMYYTFSVCLGYQIVPFYFLYPGVGRIRGRMSMTRHCPSLLRHTAIHSIRVDIMIIPAWTVGSSTSRGCRSGFLGLTSGGGD